MWSTRDRLECTSECRNLLPTCWNRCCICGRCTRHRNMCVFFSLFVFFLLDHSVISFSVHYAYRAKTSRILYTVQSSGGPVAGYRILQHGTADFGTTPGGQWCAVTDGGGFYALAASDAKVRRQLPIAAQSVRVASEWNFFFKQKLGRRVYGNPVILNFPITFLINLI